ncbi:MAG: transporter [Pirellulaceae bacterium]|nr:MAG: transporter [Pirellulaceae bacterium]
MRRPFTTGATESTSSLTGLPGDESPSPTVADTSLASPIDLTAATSSPQTPRIRTATVAVPDQPPEEDLPEDPANSSTLEEIASPQAGRSAGVTLDEVIDSLYASYPLVAAAMQARSIASGEQLAAWGQFDLKLKAASENNPVGFYENFRQSVGVVQPLFSGSDLFAGYRIGRGTFQPWYLERQTNGGGEFKAGLAVPLAKDRDIDQRRADLWKANLDRQIVEPDIRAQLIAFVQEATYAYWDWVAAGAKLDIAQQILALAEDRTERIQRQVEEGLLDPPELTDNLRLVAERRAKVEEARRKFQQSAVKLSLYYRDANGDPVVPSLDQVPEFPELAPSPPAESNRDVDIALQQRPELTLLNLVLRQLRVDYALAANEMRPTIDAVVTASQDVGEPTSPKNDKGDFELETALLVDVPVQRRKARGKMRAIQGKMAQLDAKRQLAADKIVTEVQAARAGVDTAREQVYQARDAVRRAEELAARERRNFEEGLSDLLKVTLREQYAVEAAEKLVDALTIYYKAQADLRAARGEAAPAEVP